MIDLRSTCPANGIERADLVLSRMIRYDWLSSYADINNIFLALERIGQRLRRPQPLEDAVAVLVAHETTIQRCFADFFPHIIAYSKSAVVIAQDTNPALSNDKPLG